MSKQRIINPATGKVLTEVPRLTEQEIKTVIQTARRAFDQGPWPKISLSERKDFLLKISQGILDHAQELAQLETKNTGKPIKESTFMDVPSSARTFAHFANNLEHYLKDKKIELDSGVKSQLLYEPRGVVVLIVPWNYPLLIASWKMAQALAGGNTVILKPSSLTPLTALKLAEIINQAGLPEGVVNVVNASGTEVGSTLCSDNRIDMISFTGSTETGKEIMRFASESPKKLIMELGGKSAAIILADCDIETAVSGVLTSIFLNQGQMCTAMSRILVDKNISGQFKEQFIQKAKKIKLGNGLEPETQMGPLISETHRQKVASYVEKGKAEGARILCGDGIPENPELKNGFFFKPTVFGQVNAEMSIFQQEIFGPVACISEFSGEEEAVRLANDSSFGLACSIWSSDLEKAKNLSEKINAGTIWINTYGMFYNEAPYGGFKQSGFGKELGKEGFLEYTRLKHINYNLSGEKPLVSCWYTL
ncbi:MAG: aldehyde dehydrogenase family protein [Candidatus Omnitrophota bacterium]|nr:aldehyde dehydrogenase family protein [Candidatus Omnitrophota bacterium]